MRQARGCKQAGGLGQQHPQVSCWENRLLIVVTGLVLLLAAGSRALEEPTVLDAEPMIVRGRALSGGNTDVGLPTVDASLQVLPGVDLQVQGVSGGQSDLSILGSSFSGAGLALEGVALPNAQTEHFHTALPLPPALLRSPEVQTGMEQALGSSGYLVGTVQYSLLPVHTRWLLTGGYSEHDSYWAEWLVQQEVETPAGAASVGAFAGGQDLRAVDFPDNDVETHRAGGQVQLRGEEGSQTDVLLARQEKTFGVRGYYGVNPEWAGEEETGDTLLFASHQQQWTDGRFRVAGFYREFQDDYRLYWDLPGIFENRHRLDTLGGAMDGYLGVGQQARLDWRISGVEEEIRSTALGRFSRNQFSLRGVPGYRQGRWLYQAGASVEVFSDADDEVLPLAALTYEAGNDVRVQVSYTETVRQPSYTELNFESPASLGNQGLENQTAQTAGVRVQSLLHDAIVVEMHAFYRRSRDTVDWIRRTPDATRWEAENIGTVDTLGMDAAVRWMPVQTVVMEAGYTGLDPSTDTELYASRYALDMPEHLLRLQAYITLHEKIGFAYRQGLRRQARNPLREGSRTAYPAAVLVRWKVWDQPDLSLAFEVDNLWDDDYQVFPGQEQYAARRYSTHFTLDW